MEVISSNSYLNSSPVNYNSDNFNKDKLVLLELSQSESAESLDLRSFDSTKALTLSAQQILDKINQIISDKVPNGVASLSAEQVTSEATADFVVKGITALYDSYLKSNPELTEEQALEKFITAARQGVEQGYSEAFETLKGLGAFNYEGVQQSVEQTKILIDEKLNKFESYKKEQIAAKSSAS